MEWQDLQDRKLFQLRRTRSRWKADEEEIMLKAMQDTLTLGLADTVDPEAVFKQIDVDGSGARRHQSLSQLPALVHHAW